MWRIGPNSAANPAFPRSDAATRSRDSSVGNVRGYWYADAAATAPNTYPHSAPGRAARRAVPRTTAVGARPAGSTTRLRRRILRPLAIAAVVREEQLLQ